MAKKNWIYAINPFINATVNSYRTTRDISLFHLNALRTLKDTPFFENLYNEYLPLHQSFLEAYTDWQVQGYNQFGNTLALKNLFKDLVKNIGEWDIKILNVYKSSTPAYTRIMHQGRGVFQNGAQLKRLLALKVLSDVLAEDDSLKTLSVEVTDFYTLLNDAYHNQKKAKIGTKENSANVEKQRLAICTAQYINLGLLMAHFATEPIKIELFFDMERIRRNAQSLFTKHLKPNATKFIAKRTLHADDTIELNNTGHTSICFYITQNKQAAIGETFITVEAGETKTIAAKELGNIANAHYLMAKNNDEISVGSYEVYLG